MINLKNPIKKIFSFIFTIILILSVLYFKNNIFSNKVENRNTGYRLQIEQDNSDLSNCSMQINDSKDEFTCNVIFTNNTNKNNKFSLSVYLNYSQIPFKTSQSDYSVSYEFDLASNASITIPISFISDQILYENNSLIFNIVSGINKHAYNLGEPTNLFAINSEYNLQLNNSQLNLENQVISDSDYNPININTNFSGIIVNEDFDNLNIFSKPNNALHVKSNQNVNLAVRFGGYNDINNYLIFLVLNNEQVLLNNSQNYLLFKDLNSSLNYTNITFKAPEKKGSYELWAQMAKNPLQFQNNPLTSRRRSLDYSHRITLIVE